MIRSALPAAAVCVALITTGCSSTPDQPLGLVGESTSTETPIAEASSTPIAEAPSTPASAVAEIVPSPDDDDGQPTPLEQSDTDVDSPPEAAALEESSSVGYREVNGCVLKPGADCRGADLSGVILGGIDLRGANFMYADLSGSSLSGADLTRANLAYANLSAADLGIAIIRFTTFWGADLRGANLGQAQYYTSGSLGNALTMCLRMPDGRMVDEMGWAIPESDVPTVCRDMPRPPSWRK